jgi:hypothetical protein
MDAEPNSYTDNEEFQESKNLLFSGSSIPILVKLSITRDVISPEIPVNELDSMDYKKEYKNATLFFFIINSRGINF